MERASVLVVYLLLLAVVQRLALEGVEGCAVGEVEWRQGGFGGVAVAVGL